MYIFLKQHRVFSTFIVFDIVLLNYFGIVVWFLDSSLRFKKTKTSSEIAREVNPANSVDLRLELDTKHLRPSSYR